MLMEVSFSSFNGRDQVQGWIYVPACKPRGVIQLIHGFGEHSRRYLHMIVRYLDAGFIVAADDHVGHGKTAIFNDRWGDWGDKGCHTMMEDEKIFHDLVAEKYPELPYFMFGHSMGSFITRDYIAKYGSDLTGAVICGTSGVWPDLAKGIAMAQKLVDEGKGDESDPNLATAMMGWMFSRCTEGVKLGNEWICDDPYVQEDHARDPFDAFTRPTCNRSWLYFMQMIDVITGEEWAKKVPSDLPVYNIAGDQDPVGQFGTGVYQCSNWLIDTGHDVTTVLYPGYRHEIHNYADIRDLVCDGIIGFIEDCLEEE